MNIFITGNPRCGKSTLIQKIIDEISDKKISGFITPEIRVNRIRQGFKIIDLVSGKEEILASVNIKRGPGVSRYRVNVEGIDNIMDKFLESYESSEYVIIDEIGMMEFYSKKFRDMVRMILTSNKIVILDYKIPNSKKQKLLSKIQYKKTLQFFNNLIEVLDG